MPDTIQFLTVPEIVSLMRSIESRRDRALFLVAYRHGLRASEVGMLRAEDVDFETGRLTIRRLKGSNGGVQPMQGDELRIVKRYLGSRRAGPLFFGRRESPISRRMLDVLMKRYCEAAGISPSKAHFHCLKHSIATHLLESGLRVESVRDWLGHRNIENTLMYAKLSNTRLNSEVGNALAKLPRF